jgi:hypothetical protein
MNRLNDSHTWLVYLTVLKEELYTQLIDERVEMEEVLAQHALLLAVLHLRGRAA